MQFIMYSQYKNHATNQILSIQPFVEDISGSKIL